MRTGWFWDVGHANLATKEGTVPSRGIRVLWGTIEGLTVRGLSLLGHWHATMFATCLRHGAQRRSISQGRDKRVRYAEPQLIINGARMTLHGITLVTPTLPVNGIFAH